MEKTAVEYIDSILIELIEKFNSKEYEVACNTLINFKSVVINQAKEMEKEQIIKAHGNKQKTKSNANSIVTYAYTYTGEMYFNDNYY